MAKKWNLQDIRPPAEQERKPRRTPRERSQSDITEQPVRRQTANHAPPASDTPSRNTPPRAKQSTSRTKKLVPTLVVVTTLLALGFFVSTLLGGAEVVVHPRNETTNVQATFTAHAEPAAGQLGYELLTLEADAERQVAATGQEEVSVRAEGTIRIYNAFSDEPQRLIKNTRFESPEGLIFRIQESVEIPGKRTNEQGETVPGVVTAKVFADAPGESYNIDPARFTVPGLEGTPQYESIYADSSESFVGGFEGERYIIEESELESAQQALREELRQALMSRLANERPAGFVLYEDAVTFTFNTLPATDSGDGQAVIKERGRLQAPMFKADAFGSYIAENTIAGYEGEEVLVADPYALAFAYASATTTPNTDISTLTTLSFTLSGTADLVWQFDETQLKRDLAGLQKTALLTVLSGYPAVEKAEANIRPFWKSTFPEDPEEITLTTELESTNE